MRRFDKEIINRHEIDEIIHACQVCHVAFAVDNEPYVVPLSFGYDNEAIYLHTAHSGKKIVCLEANNKVCFELEHNVQLQTDQTSVCKCTILFESIIGYGTVSEVTDPVEKERGLRLIVMHYLGENRELKSLAHANVRVWRIAIDSISGKRSLPPEREL